MQAQLCFVKDVDAGDPRLRHGSGVERGLVHLRALVVDLGVVLVFVVRLVERPAALLLLLELVVLVAVSARHLSRLRELELSVRELLLLAGLACVCRRDGWGERRVRSRIDSHFGSIERIGKERARRVHRRSPPARVMDARRRGECNNEWSYTGRKEGALENEIRTALLALVRSVARGSADVLHLTVSLGHRWYRRCGGLIGCRW